VSENCWLGTGTAGTVERLVREGATATVNGRVPEVAPVTTFCTATVKLPLPIVAGPVTEVALFAVRALLATVHGVQPVPVMRIWAVAGSKFVPTTVSENCWFASGVAGVVDKLVTVGTEPTMSGRVAEVAPVATFCTAMVKLPLPTVAGPVTEVALFAVSALFATVQGVQPGPLMTMTALEVSKFVPTTVSENCWLATGVAGVVDRLVRDGTAATVNGRVPEVAPVARFCTATVKLPLPIVAGPVTEVALFAVRAPLATVQGVQPGPLMRMTALAVSKFAPVTVSENCWLASGAAGVVDRLVTDGADTTVTVVAAERVRRMVADKAAVH